MKQRKNQDDAAEENELVAVLDLETDPFKEGRMEITPFVAGFYDGKRLEIFWGDQKKGRGDCIPRLVALLKTCKPGTLVYAHNGGNFDFHFLLEFLPVNECNFLCMGKRIVQIKLPWGVELRDSYAIIPKKLAAFAKEEVDYAHFERPAREKYKAEIIDYLKSDLRNNRKMVVEFLKRFPAKITLASSVFEMMKREFDYNPGRSSEQYDAKFRPFFFGGRVQFWQLGILKGKFTIIDINSAYPWAMTQKHWFNFECISPARVPKKFEQQSLYIIDADSDGVFPVRQKNGSIAFPTGNGRFAVTGWELVAARELKLVRNVKVLMAYVPSEVKDMRNFAQTLYDRKNAAKQAGDKEEEFFNKIAVNAGYGKLALNPKRFSEVKVTTLYDKPARYDSADEKRDNPEKPDWVNCWDDKDRELSFWKRPSYREGIDKFINVATAASITGCVRAFLMRSMAQCKGVVYCDTDSIIAGDVNKLKFGDKLGEWKVELIVDTSKPGQSIAIAGKKLYAATAGQKDKHGKTIWKKASKGVNLSAEKIVEVAEKNYVPMAFHAPTFSLFSKPKFVTREVKRADMAKRKPLHKKKK